MQEENKELFSFGYRARVWAFLRWHEGRFFTVEEIAAATGLKKSTVEQALKFVKTLPRIETRVSYENGRKIVRYGFVPIVGKLE